MNASLSPSMSRSSWPIPVPLRLVRRTLLTALAVGSALVVAEAPRIGVLIWPVSISLLMRLAVHIFSTQFFTCIFTVTALEFYWWMRSAPRDPKRKVIFGFAVLLLLALVGAGFEFLPFDYGVIFEAGLAGSMEAYILYCVWRGLFVGLLTVIYLVRKRHLFEEETRVDRANREWEYARRAVLESRLQAIQARVEPQLLFDSLARMRERYTESLVHGETLLEALIDFLRCGLPQMRSATATVFLECELLKSYTLLLRSAAFARPTLTCHLPDDAATMTIAAGSLQGLVAPWLRSASPEAEESFEIRAARAPGRISITVTGPNRDVAAGLLATEQNLRELHGSRSAITQRVIEGRLECHLEYPDDIDQPINYATTTRTNR